MLILALPLGLCLPQTTCRRTAEVTLRTTSHIFQRYYLYLNISENTTSSKVIIVVGHISEGLRCTDLMLELSMPTLKGAVLRVTNYRYY
jgi:hypothetical protein